MGKTGCTRILLFFGVLALCALALDRLIDGSIKRIRTTNYGIINRVVAGTINAEIIVSGSSRALCHYDPEILREATGETAFNLGQDGSHTDLQLALLKVYLRHNRRPHWVVQNLDVHTFEATDVIVDTGQYLPYLSEPDFYEMFGGVEADVWKWRYLPLYGYAVQDMRFAWLLGLGAAVGVQPAEDCLDGFRPHDKQWNEDFARFKARNPQGVRFKIEAGMVRDLEKIVTLCQSNQIGIVLVYSPQYQDILELVHNRAEIFDRFRSIAQRFRVPFWDYSGSEISKQKHFFYNSSHLNRRGATAFSSELAKRLVSEVRSPTR